MNKQFKKIIIMFVMVLTIIGVGAIQNENIANATTIDEAVVGIENLNNTSENSGKIGDRISNPEKGWKRYDDVNKKIIYSENGWNDSTFFTDGKFGQTTKVCMNPNNETTIKFKFKGSKLRTYGAGYSTMYSHNIISIDGIKYNMANWSDISNNVIGCSFEIRDLQYKDHIVTIEYGGSARIYLDSIDIDEDGYLLDSNGLTLVLDKSSLTLKEGNTKKITATTTPSSVDVIWSSSDNTIATVDENGKVTGIKEGTCTVTAKIDGTNLTADCIVTVTKEDIVEPEEPSIENGSLYIEMVDGNIKRADKSQIEKFKKWFISRDLDETESPIFKITNAKGNVEYLVHDKIVGFEIREN